MLIKYDSMTESKNKMSFKKALNYTKRKYRCSYFLIACITPYSLAKEKQINDNVYTCTRVIRVYVLHTLQDPLMFIHHYVFILGGNITKYVCCAWDMYSQVYVKNSKLGR